MHVRQYRQHRSLVTAARAAATNTSATPLACHAAPAWLHSHSHAHRARPIHADQPLWNARECRGKIVAVMRGPRAPAPACNYSVKLYHCQLAGAVGVIFVDWDPLGRFTVLGHFYYYYLLLLPATITYYYCCYYCYE